VGPAAPPQKPVTPAAPASPTAADSTAKAPPRLIKIPKGEPGSGFDAWVSHYEANGWTNKAVVAKHLSFVREPTEFPPGHRQHQERALS
jgi:hypothetical protein